MRPSPSRARQKKSSFFALGDWSFGFPRASIAGYTRSQFCSEGRDYEADNALTGNDDDLGSVWTIVLGKCVSEE